MGLVRVCPVVRPPFLTVWIPGDGVLAEAPQRAPSKRVYSLGWSWDQNTAGVILRPFSSAGGLPPVLG